MDDLSESYIGDELFHFMGSIYINERMQGIKDSIIEDGVYESYQDMCRYIAHGEPELFINDRDVDSKFLDATTLFQLTLVLYVLQECGEIAYDVREVHMIGQNDWKVRLKGTGVLKNYQGIDTLTVPDFKKSLRISVEVMHDQN